jgi:hypothetical protein
MKCRISSTHVSRAAGLVEHACEQGLWPSPTRNLASLGYLPQEQYVVSLIHLSLSQMCQHIFIVQLIHMRLLVLVNSF